jgi:hypothetical protein
MMSLAAQRKDVKLYFGPVFQYPPKPIQKPKPQPKFIPPTTSTKHRDAAVWRLLRQEDRVDAIDLPVYWDIMDVMMIMSVGIAVQFLETLYEYRIRKLNDLERKRQYPDVSNDLYRLEYDDEPGVYRDVCAGSLISEAIDLLLDEAERLVQRP